MFRRSFFGLVLIVFTLRTSQSAPKNKFLCDGRPSGYYADVDSGCQIYHMCDGLGRQFSYSCPNTTLFQQRMLICDHWYMVNCSRSETDYKANLLIGQNKPFVEDSEKHPYHRTPRPDLLSQPTAAEYNIVYRTSRTKSQDDFNIVGVVSDFDRNNGSTGKPSYNLPSHWSTEYVKGSATRKPARVQSKSPKFEPTTVQAYNKSTSPSAKAIDFNANLNSFKQQKTKKENVPVNFKSLFKNTTPVFPTREELTTPAANEDVLELPKVAKSPAGDLQLQISPPLLDDFNRNAAVDATPPSKYYEPPHREPNFSDSATEENKFSVSGESSTKYTKKVKVTTRQSSEKVLNDLRKMFAIPDYDFPLDNASRPSYAEGPNSFQVNPFLADVTQRQQA